MKRILQCLSFVTLIFSNLVYAEKNSLNIYAWFGEIPNEVITQFEDEYGIKVNYATFDNNEVMYTKLRTNPRDYDLALPSTHFITRMSKQGMLEILDKTKLNNHRFIDPFFLNKPYDPDNNYSIPLAWGVTGIFYNSDYLSENDIKKWSDFSKPKFRDKLMLLDEIRSVFASALRLSGYSINDADATHLHQAYLTLKSLKPNIRLFNSDAVISILIDEDAIAGMAWNGDVYAAQQENPKLQFVYPEDGFEIWVDSFVILKNAPHKANAYLFLNFLLRPNVARTITLKNHYSTTNIAAKNSLPSSIKNNPMLYPSYTILQRGEFALDKGDSSSALLEKYWEWLKMG